MSLKKYMLFFKNKEIWGGVWGGLSLAYPFLIYYFAGDLPVFYLVGAMISLLFLRATYPFFRKNKSLNFSQKNSLYLAIFMAVFMGGLTLWKSEIVPLLYPVVMSLAIAAVFASTLVYPPSMIERFARLSEPNLNAGGVTYTRKLTVAWVVFCLVNAALSLATVFLGNLKIWTLYNGCVSYVLMGLLMAGEYCFRRSYRRRA
jgi:uncharacterized membrane protein